MKDMLDDPKVKDLIMAGIEKEMSENPDTKDVLEEIEEIVDLPECVCKLEGDKCMRAEEEVEGEALKCLDKCGKKSVEKCLELENGTAARDINIDATNAIGEVSGGVGFD